MKYAFSQLKSFYAAKRGYSSFANMKAEDQVAAPTQINQILDLIWYWKGGWGFNTDRFQFTFAPQISNTASGTAGERVITLGTAVNASYSGIPVVGQLLVLGTRQFRIIRRRSSTIFVIDAPLTETISGTTCKITFDRYAMPYGVGAIKSVSILGQAEPLSFLPETITELDYSEGTPDFAYNAGVTKDDFLTGTVTTANGSAEFTYTTTVSVDHIGKSLLLKVSEKFELFKVIDVDTGANKFIVDRAFQGTGASGISFILDPRGTQLIGFKPKPIARELAEVFYITRPNKLVNDADLSDLPDDTPLIVGIELVATKWEAVGEGNINEVLFQDKKFVQSLKVLNFRNTPLQQRMFNMIEANQIMRYPRFTNPWNSPRG